MLTYINLFLLFYLVPTILSYIFAKYYWIFYQKTIHWENPGLGTIILVLTPGLNIISTGGYFLVLMFEIMENIDSIWKKSDVGARFFRMNKRKDDEE